CSKPISQTQLADLTPRPHYPDAPVLSSRGIVMVAVRTLTRAAVVVLMVAAPTIWYACSESAPDSPAGPSVAPSVLPRGNVMDLRGALAVDRKSTRLNSS